MTIGADCDAVSTVGTQDRDAGASDAGARRLWRTGISASIYLFLAYLGVAMTYPIIQLLLLRRACVDHGLDADMCKDKYDNGTKIPGYDDSQKYAANMGTVLGLATGIPQICVCLFFGVLGDSWGRRWALLSPTIAGGLIALSWAVLSPAREADALIALSCVLGLGGGSYVTNHAAMATLADATQGVSTTQRSYVFSVVEAANWAGILAGPTLGGAIGKWTSLQRAWYAIAGVNAANALFVCFCYEETLEPARRKPLRLALANPFSGVRLFFETRTTTLIFCVVVFGMLIQTGNGAVMTLFVLKVTNISGLTLGYLQSVGTAAGCLGLTFAMPLLTRLGVSLPALLVLSCLNQVVVWLLMCVASAEWYFFVVSAGNVLQAVFYPIVRTGMVNTFGTRRYGEALAAVGVVQQATAMVAPVVFQQIYRASEDTEWRIGELNVKCVTMLVGVVCGVLGMFSAALIKDIPKARPDGASDGDAGGDDGAEGGCGAGAGVNAALLPGGPARGDAGPVAA